MKLNASMHVDGSTKVDVYHLEDNGAYVIRFSAKDYGPSFTVFLDKPATWQWIQNRRGNTNV